MSKNLKLFFEGVIFGVFLALGGNFLQEKVEEILLAQITVPSENVLMINFPRKPPLSLDAKSAISVKTNLENFERIIFAKDIDSPLPIASLTKLMTALIVLEENYNFEDIVTISLEAAQQKDAPIFGNLAAGEEFKIKELLELMLIYSSNDAAFALSEVIGAQKFIEKMNEKAKLIGMGNTHFVNPTGLDPEEIEFNKENFNKFNYSTAKDLLKLSEYILKHHPQIFEISKKPPSFLIPDSIFNIFITGELVGGKTGYTLQSGGSLLFIFKDEKNPQFFYINLILGTATREKRIEEMQKLIDWINI